LNFYLFIFFFFFAIKQIVNKFRKIAEGQTELTPKCHLQLLIEHAFYELQSEEKEEHFCTQQILSKCEHICKKVQEKTFSGVPKDLIARTLDGMLCRQLISQHCTEKCYYCWEGKPSPALQHLLKVDPNCLQAQTQEHAVYDFLSPSPSPVLLNDNANDLPEPVSEDEKSLSFHRAVPE
ncbi:hypothetical protein RFI_10958, partial [Reticulomyxa filosa]